MTDAAIVYHQLHPPDEVRVFTISKAAVRRFDDEVLVFDLRYGHLGFRHYSFARRWYAINCTRDLDGRAVNESSAAGPFSFNCDVSTPMRRAGDGVYEVDLELDVLVQADARTHVVTDRDRFERAVRAGWIAPHERAGAEAGLAELIELVTTGHLEEWLASMQAFDDFTHRPRGTPHEVVPLSRVPILARARRAEGPPP